MNLVLDNHKAFIDNSKGLEGLELKQYCLKYGLHKLYDKSWFVFEHKIGTGVFPKGMSENLGLKYLNAYASFAENEKVKKVCYNLCNSRRQRTKRLNKKITDMLYVGQCYFLTLTFTDETLSNTNCLTRRRYVSRYLKSQTPYYIANVDFGSLREREHFHAVVFGQIDFNPWHKYGAINCKTIFSKFNDESRVKLAKYITKLTNHAIKNTAKNFRCIYSKNWNDLVLKKRIRKVAEKDETVKIGLDLFGDDLKLY
jgi:hypothetical protein